MSGPPVRPSPVRPKCFASGRSLQHGDANLTPVEVDVVVNSTLKHQGRRSLCFWKFVSLHPICKIEFHLRPEPFLSIREYASHYRRPLFRRVVGQYTELETLPYPNFRLHLNPFNVFCFSSLRHHHRPSILSTYHADYRRQWAGYSGFHGIVRGVWSGVPVELLPKCREVKGMQS